ncbi:flagellar biosynthesis regulator FlaF [Skermanella mucosa]|uniref:flagellar biosynthesis regulator FlaF n=1 Tax=Skermanella mucosa TaxID=1789672 RepID=UPI00192B92ED|nr:flagellar biosynthesis regulator FlaF [Skermanella mucosa]UEM20882.1 flagellar biosynthesis regulator FlaF [Skermanella mucosa]
MNPKLNAYKQAAMMNKDYRSQEANLFKRVTFGLIEGKANPDGLGLVRAASDNRLLWQTVVSLLRDDQNRLPAPLRAQIISIGQTVIREIDENATGKLDVDFLIDINTQMIEGLAALPEATVTPAPTIPQNQRLGA